MSRPTRIASAHRLRIHPRDLLHYLPLSVQLLVFELSYSVVLSAKNLLYAQQDVLKEDEANKVEAKDEFGYRFGAPSLPGNLEIMAWLTLPLGSR